MSTGPQHILITRLSAIGDCVLTLPLASAIKQAFPQSRISWAVSCAAKSLIEICPDVDQVISVSKRWVSDVSEWRRLRQLFRDDPVDCVVDPQGLTKSALLGWLSGAPQRIGFKRPVSRELAPWLNTMAVDRAGLHLVDAQLRLLKPLGIECARADFRLSIPDETTAWAKSTIRQLVGDSAPAIVNSGAGWESRMWPAERYGHVAAWLKSNRNIPTVIVWAGDAERKLSEEIARTSGGAAVVAPDTNLVQLAAILRQAGVFISSDTGPMHIAAAVGTQCLSLHGPTRPEMSGPYGEQHLSIQKVIFDGSSRTRRSADNSAMKAIDVGNVCDRLDEIIKVQGMIRSAA